jgi:sensor histidine kinase YesM
MDTRLLEMSLKKFLRILFLTVMSCTLIALFLTSVKFGGTTFLSNFIVTQCLGIAIFLCVFIVRHILKPANPIVHFIAIVIAITIGSIGGSVLGFVVIGEKPSRFVSEYAYFIHIVLFGILFGSIITYYFFSRERIHSAEALMQEEKIKRLTTEKKAVETNLRLLQAQIEPHFLFNTLSNILSLLDTDLNKGKSMLMDLIRYLRTSLVKTRAEATTLGQEIEMIKAYLNIFKVRMEGRLRYRIDIPDSIKDLPFPPMLVQPLVENAIKHGIEPKIEGGEVTIRARKNGDIIRVELADTGTGLYEDGDMGFGLSNVRERLQSLYGDRGRLILEENRPSGLKAIIEVPHGRDQGDHRR